MEVNRFQCFFLRLRIFLTCLVIHGRLLFDLRGTNYGMNEDVTEIKLPFNIDHASSTDDLVSTDESVLAAHS